MEHGEGVNQTTELFIDIITKNVPNLAKDSRDGKKLCKPLNKRCPKNLSQDISQPNLELKTKHLESSKKKHTLSKGGKQFKRQHISQQKHWKPEGRGRVFCNC